MHFYEAENCLKKLEVDFAEHKTRHSNIMR